MKTVKRLARQQLEPCSSMLTSAVNWKYLKLATFTWRLSMSWHKLLVKSSSSAFNQSSISNLFTSRASSLLLTYQPGTKGAEQIWKEWREFVKLFETCKSSFSLCQTGAWGSRGWDGAIGNLFHQRGIMCIESTVLHNTQYQTFSVEKSRGGCR